MYFIYYKTHIQYSLIFYCFISLSFKKSTKYKKWFNIIWSEFIKPIPWFSKFHDFLEAKFYYSQEKKNQKATKLREGSC